jgi:hypothetical protein
MQTPTARFLWANGAIAAVGFVLLHALVGVGVAASWANGVQAVLTLELNFVAGLLYTWRYHFHLSRAGLSLRWIRFHIGRGGSLLVNVAVFPLIVPAFGATGAFVALLVFCALGNLVVDRFWVFAPAPYGGAPPVKRGE